MTIPLSKTVLDVSVPYKKPHIKYIVKVRMIHILE